MLTIFRAGNSDVVALNPILKEKYGFKTGVKIIQEDSENGILIRPLKPKTKKKESKVNKDFNNWLKGALEEDSLLLDELK